MLVMQSKSFKLILHLILFLFHLQYLTSISPLYTVNLFMVITYVCGLKTAFPMYGKHTPEQGFMSFFALWLYAKVVARVVIRSLYIIIIITIIEVLWHWSK